MIGFVCKPGTFTISKYPDCSYIPYREKAFNMTISIISLACGDSASLPLMLRSGHIVLKHKQFKIVTQTLPDLTAFARKQSIAYRSPTLNSILISVVFTPITPRQPTRPTKINAVEINRWNKGVNICLGTICHGSN